MSGLNLAQFDLFSALPKGDLDVLERILVVGNQRAGHVFISEGDRGSSVTSSLYLILNGEIAISARIPGRGDVPLKTMKTGEIFGLVSFLDDGRRSATCAAKTEVTTARLSRAVFNALFQRHGGVHARFQMAVAQQLTADIRGLERMLVDAAAGDDAAINNRFRQS